MSIDADTSFYNHYNPDPNANPIGRGLDLRQTMLQNRLLRAKVDMGNVYKQAIDPVTGQIDENKLVQLTASNPHTAPIAGDVAQQSLTRRQAAISTWRSQLEGDITRNEATNRYIGSVSANPTKANVLDTLVQGQKDGNITPQKAAELYASLPAEDTPKAIQGWLVQHQLQNQQVGDQLRTVYGDLGTLDDGQNIRVVRQSPVSGIHQIASIPKTLSPDQLAGETSWFNPQNGRNEKITMAQLLQKAGYKQPVAAPAVNAPGAVIGQPGQPETAPAASPAPTRPAVKPAAAPITTPAAKTAAPPAAPGGVPAGPSLGETEEAGRSTSALTDFQKEVSNSKDYKFQAQRALEAVESSGETGPGTEYVQSVKKIYQAFSPDMIKKYFYDIDPDKMESRDEANKFMTRLAMTNAASIGQGTNDKLAAAFAGTANADMSKLAIKDILKTDIALMNYKQAQSQAWDMAKDRGEVQDKDFLKWAGQWSRNTDPRLFTLDVLDSAKRTKMINGMTDKEAIQFAKRHKELKADGLL